MKKNLLVIRGILCNNLMLLIIYGILSFLGRRYSELIAWRYNVGIITNISLYLVFVLIIGTMFYFIGKKLKVTNSAKGVFFSLFLIPTLFYVFLPINMLLSIHNKIVFWDWFVWCVPFVAVFKYGVFFAPIILAFITYRGMKSKSDASIKVFHKIGKRKAWIIIASIVVLILSYNLIMNGFFLKYESQSEFSQDSGWIKTGRLYNNGILFTYYQKGKTIDSFFKLNGMSIKRMSKNALENVKDYILVEEGFMDDDYDEKHPGVVYGELSEVTVKQGGKIKTRTNPWIGISNSLDKLCEKP